jgi:hypothetical protein
MNACCRNRRNTQLLKLLRIIALTELLKQYINILLKYKQVLNARYKLISNIWNASTDVHVTDARCCGTY